MILITNLFASSMAHPGICQWYVAHARRRGDTSFTKSKPHPVQAFSGSLLLLDVVHLHMMNASACWDGYGGSSNPPSIPIQSNPTSLQTANSWRSSQKPNQLSWLHQLPNSSCSFTGFYGCTVLKPESAVFLVVTAIVTMPRGEGSLVITWAWSLWVWGWVREGGGYVPGANGVIR